jgi:hypothetical protein
MPLFFSPNVFSVSYCSLKNKPYKVDTDFYVSFRACLPCHSFSGDRIGIQSD